MKIRTGFVSNSSSASYYITIKQTPEEFYRTVDELMSYPWTNPDLARIEVNKAFESSVGSDKYWDTLGLPANNETSERTKALAAAKINIENNPSPKSIFNCLLLVHGIDITEFENRINLAYFSVIHNNYSESIPTILEDIILAYTFERTGLIECIVDHQD